MPKPQFKLPEVESGVDYDYNTPLPQLPLPGSKDVNIILAVRDHAPERVKQIIKEVDLKTKQILALEEEKNTLMKLIAVVDPTNEVLKV